MCLLQKMDEEEAIGLHLVQIQNEALIRENEMLARENIELKNMYSELRQSLDKAVGLSYLAPPLPMFPPEFRS